MDTNKIKLNSSIKKLKFYEKINFIFLFVLLLFTLIYSIYFDYQIRDYRGVDYFIYFTHLSNILIFIYLFLYLIFRKTNKLILLALPSIVITGILFMVFCFPVWFSFSIYLLFNTSTFDQYMDPSYYFPLSFFLTLLLHFFVPLFSYLTLKKHFIKESKNINEAIFAIVSFLFIYFLLVQVSLFFSLDNTEPGIKGEAPYFFVDLRWMYYFQYDWIPNWSSGLKIFLQILIYFAFFSIYVFIIIFSIKINHFLQKKSKNSYKDIILF